MFQELGKDLLGRPKDKMLGKYEQFGDPPSEKYDMYEWIDVDTTKSPSDDDYYMYGGSICEELKTLLMSDKMVFIAIDVYDGSNKVDDNMSEEDFLEALEAEKDEDLATTGIKCI